MSLACAACRYLVMFSRRHCQIVYAVNQSKQCWLQTRYTECLFKRINGRRPLAMRKFRSRPVPLSHVGVGPRVIREYQHVVDAIADQWPLSHSACSLKCRPEVWYPSAWSARTATEMETTRRVLRRSRKRRRRTHALPPGMEMARRTEIDIVTG